MLDYVSSGLSRMDTLQECLFTALVKYRARTAFVYNDLILSYQELEKYALRISELLSKLGYESSRIALIFDNKVLLVYFTTWRYFFSKYFCADIKKNAR